jgi:hypothetical protein
MKRALLLAVIVLIFAAPALSVVHGVHLAWAPVTKDTKGATLTVPVYYNVWRDISGTQKYSKQTTSPISCTNYFDIVVVPGTSYDYQITAWTEAAGDGPLSAKSGDVVIPK